MNGPYRLAGAVACALALANFSAGAEEATVCVACTEPARTYHCGIDTSLAPKPVTLKARTVADVCPPALRRLHKHKACAVVPSSTPCAGVETRLGLDVLRTLSRSEGAEDTVVPGIGERFSTAAEEAGTSMANAVKKSWRCVSTLLQDC